MTAPFRHPYTKTASSMATTLSNIGRQRPEQEVRVLTTRCGVPFGPQRLVAVGNQYFRVLDQTYRQLMMGVRPDELELDEADPDEEEEFE